MPPALCGFPLLLALIFAQHLERDLDAVVAGHLLTVPLAMVGLVNPMVAAAAMSVSSVLVVGDSLRLRAWQPAPASARGREQAGVRGRKPVATGGGTT